jgi:hypothetical protein
VHNSKNVQFEFITSFQTWQICVPGQPDNTSKMFGLFEQLGQQKYQVEKQITAIGMRVKA